MAGSLHGEVVLEAEGEDEVALVVDGKGGAVAQAGVGAGAGRAAVAPMVCSAVDTAQRWCRWTALKLGTSRAGLFDS